MKTSFKQDYISERPPLHFGEGLGVRLFTALALFALLSACSCKRDCQDPTNPDCENYNPCFGKTQPSAKFIMEETNIVLANEGIWVADSAFLGYSLRFRSEYTDSKYKHTWYVGNEIFNSHTTPSRSFENLPRPQFISISHVLEYTPDLQCFPDDDGKDSVAQKFLLIASPNTDFQTYGTYRGALNGSLDSFDVQVIAVDINGQPAGFNTYYDDVFINFHNNGDTIQSNSGKVAGYLYNHHGFIPERRSQVAGQIEVFADGTFLWSYQATNPNVLNGDMQKHEFRGRKIN